MKQNVQLKAAINNLRAVVGQPKRYYAYSFFCLLAFIILVVASPPGRTAIKAAAFLPQVLPNLPVRPLEWFSGAPSRQEVFYPISSGVGNADLYVPAEEGKHSAVLLFLGVNPAGRDDPRVVGLANALARTGSVVMIPWSDSMTQRRVEVQEIDNLVHAFQYLTSLDIVDGKRAGMGGFCVGASLATVAAQDERIRENVRFVNFFGGYYNARDLVRSVVTRTRFDEEGIESWNPNWLSNQVVASHLIEGLASQSERDLLTEALLGNSILLDGQVNSLSSEAKTVHRLIQGVESDEVDILISNLPEATLNSIQLISPSTRVSDLKARAIIMHDREDNLVPSEESRRFANALQGQQEAYYTEFSFFQHVDPTRPVSPPVFLKEGFKFYLHMYQIMKELS